MASDGRHLKNQTDKARSSGAHLSEKDRQQAEARQARSRSRRVNVKKGAPQMIIMLLLCVIMITPMRSCIISDGDYIGVAAAREAALEYAGISQDTAENISAEMIKVGDTVCYKVQFTGSVTEYRYIVDARSGAILGQSFHRTEG